MDRLEIREHLREVPLFSRLSVDNLELVAGIAHLETFPRRSHLFNAGQPGQEFVLILSGEAVVRAIQPGGHLRPVGYLYPGDSAGVTSLLLGEPHDATVEAMTDVTVLVLERRDFTRLRHELPDLEAQLTIPREIMEKLRHSRLPWLVPGEVLVFYGQRHWLAFAKLLALPLFLFALLCAPVLAIFAALHWSLYIGAALLLVPFLGILVWYYVDWRNDYLAVSTQRVVRRELILFTYESMHEAPLDRVQDVLVKYDTLGRFFGYGELSVQTAAKSGIDRVVFGYLPHPGQAAAAVTQQMYRAQAQVLTLADETIRRELKRRLGWITREELIRGQERVAPAQEEEEAPTPPPAQHRRRLLAPLREQEGSRITWRKHWYFLLQRITMPLLAFLAWLAVAIAFFSAGAISTGMIVGLLVAGLAIALWLLWEIADWENDIYILTDDRIIDIEKRPVFGAEDRREASLDRVQNVNLVVPSRLATILRFGNVDIDTAGGEGQFTFSGVMAPHQVQREVMSRVAQYRERRQLVESRQRQTEIAEWFAIYEGLRTQRAGSPQGGQAAQTDVSPEAPGT